MRTRSRAFASLSVLAALLAASVQGQAPFQVKDIRTVVDPFLPAVFGLTNFVETGGVAFFHVSDGIHGIELWRSDGTAAGTRLVKDVCPGVCSDESWQIVAAGSLVYFNASDDPPAGLQLWKSDGTAAGTVPAFPPSSPYFRRSLLPWAELNGVVLLEALGSPGLLQCQYRRLHPVDERRHRSGDRPGARADPGRRPYRAAPLPGGRPGVLLLRRPAGDRAAQGRPGGDGERSTALTPRASPRQ